MRIVIIAVSFCGFCIALLAPVKHKAAAPTVAAVSTSATTVLDPPRTDTVIERGYGGHFTTFANVNSETIRFVVDTGADTVALTEDDARRAHVSFDPSQFRVVGRGAAGPVTGQEIKIASVVLDGKRVDNVTGVVLHGSDVSLLGQTFLSHLDSVEIKNDQMILR